MKSSYFNIVLGVFVISLLSFSCSSNLDFNQVDNFKSEPVIVANLAYFDVPANEFVTNGIEQNPDRKSVV